MIKLCLHLYASQFACFTFDRSICFNGRTDTGNKINSRQSHNEVLQLTHLSYSIILGEKPKVGTKYAKQMSFAITESPHEFQYWWHTVPL